MKRLLFLIIILLLVLFGLSFASLNPEPVALRYYFGSLELPLSLLLSLVLAFGALLGMLVSLSLWLREKRRCAHLQRRVRLNEKEIRNLREIPIKDSH